jgi:hypothetical protein
MIAMKAKMTVIPHPTVLLLKVRNCLVHFSHCWAKNLVRLFQAVWSYLTPLSLVARQAKYLKQKFGGGEDEMIEDKDQNDEDEINKKSWGGRKNIYYNADTADFEVVYYFISIEKLVSATVGIGLLLDTTVA